MIKFERTLTKKKLMMASVSWNQRDNLLVEFMEPGNMVNEEAYLNILKNLPVTIINKISGLLTAKCNSIIMHAHIPRIKHSH